MKTHLLFLLILIPSFIFSQNKVGINTTSPDYQLDVKSTTIGEESDLQLINSDGTKFLRIYSGNSSNNRTMLLFNRSDTFRIANSDPDSSLFKNRLTINPNGNVGINNSNPGYEIDAMGLNNNDAAELNVRTPDNATFLRLNSGRVSDPAPKILWKQGTNLILGDDNFGFTEKFRFQSNGRMGINEFSPQGKLHIKENSTSLYPQLRLTEIGSDYSRIKMESSVHPNSFWDIAGKADTDAGAAKLNFYFTNSTTSGDRMTITGEGDVGIGTSSPSSKLDVNGKIEIGDDAGSASAGSIRFNSNTNDFEGYNGTDWVSLTKSSSYYGNISISESFGKEGSDAVNNDYFGSSVFIDGDFAVVGSPFHDTNGNNGQGKAYVFEKSFGAWNEVAILTASDGLAGHQFGRGVSISGDVVIVGSPFFNGGKVYLFEKPGGGWSNMTETAQLSPSDGGANDNFGFDTDIDNETVIVASRRHSSQGTWWGKAYVFVKPGGGWSNMTETAQLTYSNSVNDTQFGYSVSISDSTILVGSRIKKAFIFEKPLGGWVNATEDAILEPSNPSPANAFAEDLHIYKDEVIIGVPDEAIGSNSFQGKAYIFEKPPGGWTNINEIAQIWATDGLVASRFGSSVSIFEGIILVGAQEHNSDTGGVYLFEKPPGGWSDMTQTFKLSPSDDSIDSHYGNEISISSGTILIGAREKDISGNTNIGKVYFFDR